MHGLEDVLVLYPYLEAEFVAFGAQARGQMLEIDIGFADVDQHYHGKQALHRGLGYVEDVNVGVGEDCAYSGYDAYPVCSDNCDHCTHILAPVLR